ncbi:MAG TPA: septal ring lytic transglycosylase RlpA family protein [Candidatus Binataceae bacterium]|jgi:rare lipoprotein A|nr:septal ring lytic transglycosylase RlpA family protein [Candidatus Binataceae bacterium]
MPRFFDLSIAILALTVVTLPVASAPCAESSTAAASSAAVPGKTLKAKATLYPNACEGHETAAGTTFHQADHVAASNKLPLGTTVKVTNLTNGKSTKVTVLDHGPALGAHRIDLSQKAAKEIGLTHQKGITPVKVKITSTPAPDQANPPGDAQVSR